MRLSSFKYLPPPTHYTLSCSEHINSDTSILELRKKKKKKLELKTNKNYSSILEQKKKKKQVSFCNFYTKWIA